MIKAYRLTIFAAFCFTIFLMLGCFILLLNLVSLKLSYFFISGVLTIALSLYLKHYYKKKKFKQKILQRYKQIETIINNIEIALYLKDTEGKILISNTGHKDIFGRELQDLTGEKASELFFESEQIDKEDLNIIKNHSTYDKIKKLTVRTTNNKVWLKIRKSPVFDDDNKVCAIVVTIINYDKAVKIEEEKNSFVATITHDLKTPASAQIRALDLLLNNRFGELKREQREIINEIKNSCKYMSSLIFSILDTYVYDNGQTKLRYEKFCLLDLAQECIRETSCLAGENNQKIRIISPKTDTFVQADRTQIKRVIINLISNAIWYGRKNTIIEISIEEFENKITFSVKNHSVYIPKDKMELMFEKYRRGDEYMRSKTGCGLGLYLSKQIIMLHRGEIKAESSDDNMCKFSFSIPVNHTKAAEPIVRLAG